MIKKFFTDIATRARHCNCGCDAEIKPGEIILRFDYIGIYGNLKVSCAKRMIAVIKQHRKEYEEVNS